MKKLYINTRHIKEVLFEKGNKRTYVTIFYADGTDRQFEFLDKDDAKKFVEEITSKKFKVITL